MKVYLCQHVSVSLCQLHVSRVPANALGSAAFLHDLIHAAHRCGALLFILVPICCPAACFTFSKKKKKCGQLLSGCYHNVLLLGQMLDTACLCSVGIRRVETLRLCLLYGTRLDLLRVLDIHTGISGALHSNSLKTEGQKSS